MLKTLLSTTILLFIVGCESPNGQVRELLSDRGVASLQHPTKVEVYRVEAPSERRDADRALGRPLVKTTDEKIAGYPLVARGKDQGPDFARRLTGIFLDASTYSFDSAKGCEFDPGVVFRVFSGNDSLDLVLCFHCREFEVFLPQADGKTHRGHEDFDNAAGRLIKLAQEALPDDAAIQQLK
jgi:hypothetical protein